jgi:predicted DNA-binding transcriptional regulator AlpA
MNPNRSDSGVAVTAALIAEKASLSKWVNERLPALDQLLTAHEVSRLIRRSKCAVYALSALGRFPKRWRFQGREIGWRRADVDLWLRQGSKVPIHAQGDGHPPACPSRRSSRPQRCRVRHSPASAVRRERIHVRREGETSCLNLKWPSL